MRWASEHLQGRDDIVFARRLITRATHTGSDHDPVTSEQFVHLAATGSLAWQWRAHGFDYGILAHYASDVAAGRVVVVNGSRAHCSQLQGKPKVKVVQITTDAEKLAERLAQRGRDAPHEVSQRLARNVEFEDWRADHTIVNRGELAYAGLEVANYLTCFC